MSQWIKSSNQKPPHCAPVLLWVESGPIHLGESYADVGIWNDVEKRFQVEYKGDDIAIEASFWAKITPPPRREA